MEIAVTEFSASQAHSFTCNVNQSVTEGSLPLKLAGEVHKVELKRLFCLSSVGGLLLVATGAALPSWCISMRVTSCCVHRVVERSSERKVS